MKSLKSMQTKILVVALAAVSASAYADVFVRGSSRSESPANSASPVNMSDSSYVYKQAILEGQDSAAAVLDGSEPSDMFARTRAAAEEYLGVEFLSDREAAIAIMEMAQSLSQ